MSQGMSAALSPLFRPLSELLAAVEDGATLAVTKFNPVAALLGLVAAERRNLHVIGVPTAGFGADLLVAGGAAARIEAGALVIGNYGIAPNIVRAVEAGTVELLDSSCPVIELQLIAGASGLGFTPLAGLAGTEMLAHRPDFKIVADPFDPRYDVVLAPALRPDVAIIHGLRADPAGNVVTTIDNEDRLVVRAARCAVATVEEVREDALAALAADEEVIPEMCLDAISVVPGGAWPFACRGYYGEDRAAVAGWLAAARDAETMAEHLARLVAAGTREPAHAPALA